MLNPSEHFVKATQAFRTFLKTLKAKKLRLKKSSQFPEKVKLFSEKLKFLLP